MVRSVRYIPTTTTGELDVLDVIDCIQYLVYVKEIYLL